MGLPTFPSCYSHIASASGSVLPEASGRFLLHKLGLILSPFIAVGSSGYGGLGLHRHSGVASPYTNLYGADGKYKHVGSHPRPYGRGLPADKVKETYNLRCTRSSGDDA